MPGSKRKRKGKADPPSNGVNLSNQFDLLSDDESDPSSNQKSNKVSRLSAKKVRIPPVVVKFDFRTVRSAVMDNLKKFKFVFQLGRRGECRVQAETIEGYKHLQTLLSQKEYQFFTYDTKEERLFKVVLKGLPSDETLADVKKELTRLLEPIVPVQVIEMKMKSRPGDLRNGTSSKFYLVHFKSSELNNLKALEKASLMFQTRVQWEHFRKSGGSFQNLTQCRKCQAWGHGTKHCHMMPKCMICGEPSHVKDNCPVKDHPTKFKCANCGKCHKSNYFECDTRKAILKSRAKRQVGNGQRFQSGTNSSAVNNGQRGRNSEFVPVGTNRAHGSNSSNIHAANNGQRVNGTTYADVAAGMNQNTNRQNLPNGNSDEFDLGSITAPKMEFLQNSIIDMISQMMRTNSMFEAVQTGVKFANNIVMALKFNHGP